MRTRSQTKRSQEEALAGNEADLKRRKQRAADDLGDEALTTTRPKPRSRGRRKQESKARGTRRLTRQSSSLSRCRESDNFDDSPNEEDSESFSTGSTEDEEPHAQLSRRESSSHSLEISSTQPLTLAAQSSDLIQVPFLGLDEQSGKPHYVTEHQIFEHLKQHQTQFMPSCDYMDRQPDIDSGMRSILVDWLVEVAEEYKLKPPTLYLAVSIIDRYLDRVTVTRKKLQLVGVASMLIACKVEEIFPPHVEDFVFISDNTYTRTQIVKMERAIQREMDHHVGSPTVYTFLRRFQKCAQLDDEVLQLSNFLAELTILEYSFVRYEPSMIAASAVALALHTIMYPPWSTTLERYSGYKVADLAPCIQPILQLFIESATGALQAVREKYSSPNPYLCVANIPRPESYPIM